MAKLLDIDIFVIAHQPQEGGWLRAGENLIIIASDHNHGCLLTADLTKPAADRDAYKVDCAAGVDFITLKLLN